ncbi:MAG: sulfite exporter TauE/SafE family protein [Deltaproteobacteria bacterium]|nr:sulfite exporter TauE/SafE family protein [Deltaproteobacteria bacterium]
MFNIPIILAGFLVGIVVGLTGMGGGALMTPILVLGFGIDPLSAVSSDIVASLVMKPVGGGVHWKRGTVNWRLVRWLVMGSVPAAFLGVLLLRGLGEGAHLQGTVKFSLGVALLVVAVGLVIRPLLMRKRAGLNPNAPLIIRPIPTVLIGIAGGLVVGITSVGSGSLMMILLLLLYPRLHMKQLVGTDLIQAIPLVASAAIGHLLFGSFNFQLMTSIVIGAIPGVFLAARYSSRAPDRVIRPILVLVLTSSSMKLLNAGTVTLAASILVLAGAATAWSIWLPRSSSVATETPETPPSPAPSQNPV